MANVRVVVTESNGATPVVGAVFEGLKFFLIRRLPTRSQFVADIEANGGTVVKLEAQADYVIADHVRNDAPGGSYSYTFIEAAVRTGELPNPADHATGGATGPARPVGAAVPGKSTRTPFSAEDDRILWTWVKTAEAQGGSVKGNEIYKKLEAVNPRHTFQAWRDRYVKRLIDTPPAGVDLSIGANQPPTPPTTTPDDEEGMPLPSKTEQSAKRRGRQSTEDHPPSTNVDPAARSSQLQTRPGHGRKSAVLQARFDTLLENAPDIELIPPEVKRRAWETWAETIEGDGSAPLPTPEEWQDFYVSKVRPVYLNRQASQNKSPTPPNHADHGPQLKHKEDGGVPNKASAAVGRPTTSEGSNNRKRKRSSPRSTSSQSSSKSRAVSPVERYSEQQAELKAGRDEDGNTALVEQDPTLEANRATDEQIGLEADTGLNAIEGTDTIAAEEQLTSEANQAANMQLRREASKASGEVAEIFEQLGSITSDIWTVKKDHTELKAGDFVGRPTAVSKKRKGASLFSSESTVESQIDPLTEANLAAQQAHHRVDWSRAADLPQDDENQDQSDFIAYLQTTIGQNWRNLFRSTREDDAFNSGQAFETTSTLGQEIGGLLQASAAVQNKDRTPPLPFSSQDELDEVVEKNLDWPASPQHNESLNSQPESQPFDMEQAHRPAKSSFVAADFVFSSQSLVSQSDDREAAILGDNEENTISDYNGANGNDLDDNDEDMTLRPETYDLQEEDIDLTVAEPEGGFELGSSQPRPGDAATQAETAQYNVVEAMEHSSRASSSSLYSSSASQSEESHLHDRAVETQDIVNAETQQPDLGMVLPPSGSEEEDDDYSTSQPLKDSLPADSEDGDTASRSFAKLNSKRGHALETQDIVNAETQWPDLNLMLPFDENDADRTSRDLSSYPASRHEDQSTAEKPETETQSEDAETFVSRMQARGFDVDEIFHAMSCTSMRPDLAEMVLIERRAGHQLPSISGIWSEEEDTILQGGDARALKRLEEKHGWVECKARMDWLTE